MVHGGNHHQSASGGKASHDRAAGEFQVLAHKVNNPFKWPTSRTESETMVKVELEVPTVMKTELPTYRPTLSYSSPMPLGRTLLAFSSMHGFSTLFTQGGAT